MRKRRVYTGLRGRRRKELEKGEELEKKERAGKV